MFSEFSNISVISYDFYDKYFEVMDEFKQHKYKNGTTDMMLESDLATVHFVFHKIDRVNSNKIFVVGPKAQLIGLLVECSNAIVSRKIEWEKEHEKERIVKDKNIIMEFILEQKELENKKHGDTIIVEPKITEDIVISVQSTDDTIVDEINKYLNKGLSICSKNEVLWIKKLINSIYDEKPNEIFKECKNDCKKLKEKIIYIYMHTFRHRQDSNRVFTQYSCILFAF